MNSMIRSFTEISVLLSLTFSSAHGSEPITGGMVLGARGPLMPDSTGTWKEFRTTDEQALLSDAGDDKRCVEGAPSNLRQLFFEHFRYYSDHSKTKIGETEIARFAKVLGMAPHESSGATAAVTDMRLRGDRETLRLFFGVDNRGVRSPSPLFSSTDSLEKLFALRNVKWDRQTNFGLVQMSADRLASNSEAGDLAEAMIVNMKELYQSRPDEVIDRCGTGLMYKDSPTEIRGAFDEMQKCEVGYTTKAKVQCFGLWATLCPNYNLSLALIATPRYFATRKAAPLCAKTFRKILRTGRGDGGIHSAPARPAVVKPKTPVMPKSKPSAKPTVSTKSESTPSKKPTVTAKPTPKKSTPKVRTANSGYIDSGDFAR